MFCGPLQLAYKLSLPRLTPKISYRKQSNARHKFVRYVYSCNTPSPRIQVGDLVVVALPFGKYRVAKVTGFDYSGRTADVIYLDEKQAECFYLQDGNKSFEKVENMLPVTSRYNSTKVCYEISKVEIQRVLSSRGPVATAVVSNPSPILFQVRKPTKQQALYGGGISIGMSFLLNLLYTQIHSNEYIHSQWFANVLLLSIHWTTYLCLVVGFGLLLGGLMGKFE